MPNKDKYYIKNQKQETDQSQGLQTSVEGYEDTERIKIERELCEKAGVNYPETFENDKQREFEYFRKLFPETYRITVDTLYRVLDERDGQEYITYHVYRYVTQYIALPNGTKVNREHAVDSYEGFYHNPVTSVREFNPDGTPRKSEILRLEKVYTIPWSKANFEKIVDDPLNTITTIQLYLGIATQDASRDVPVEGSTQLIRNRSDFSDHDWETTMQLGRSQLSRITPSIDEIKKTIELRKKLEGSNTTATVKTKS